MIVKTFESISEIDRSQWNNIVGANRLICRHEYLEAIENSNINDCKYFYPVVYKDGIVAAHSCLYFISTELDLFAGGFVKSIITTVRHIWPEFLVMRSIECGTPVALGSTISFRDNSCVEQALELIIEESERIASRLGVNVLLFRDYYEEDLERYDAMKSVGYTRIHNLPTARMRVQWSTFEEYLMSMRHEYRRKARIRLQHCKEDKITCEVVNNFAYLSEELAILWRNTYDNASEYKREFLTSQFFSQISDSLGDNSRVITVRIDGRLAGFSLILLDDDILEWVFCGLDYMYNSKHKVYFKMIYKIVEFAIEEEFKEVDFGITTVPAKLDVGAVVKTQYMYMKHLGNVGRRIVPKIFDWMTPQPTQVQRNVFKTKGTS